MVIMLLVKVVKLAWHDNPVLQNIIQELNQFGTLGERHLLISLTAMEELIVEMGYVTRGKNLLAHRRISVNFRDQHLYHILTKSLECIKQYSESVLTQQAMQNIQLDQQKTGTSTSGQSSNIMVENLL